jgi:predicted ATPase/DNA-binding winged helix-turn-helix (wHTH) protein
LALSLTRSDCFSFGSWCWLRNERVLLRAGSPVPLSSCAREILALLLEDPGALVTNERIIAQIWRGTFVVDVAVGVHIAQLRRVLRDGLTCYVRNVRGVGYRFVVPSPQSFALPDALRRHRESDVIGRFSIIDTVRDRIPHSRLVTIAGPGGVGKSVVTMAAADLPRSHGMDVRVVDMLEMNSAARFNQAVASALQMEPPIVGSSTGTAGSRGTRECLLVADNCDHGLRAAASCFEHALQRAPGLRILATCRRSLGTQYEHVVRLHPLELPPDGARMSAAEAAQFSSIAFFVKCARASADNFELTDTNAATVAAICARLDGLPLAIELAALRVHELGLPGLAVPAELLLDLLARGQRTSPPHHRTLRALLDSSYESLSPEEQPALRCLAAFAEEFTIEEAAAVIPDGVLDTTRLPKIIASLRESSLVEVHGGGVSMTYRLLNIHRAFALAKLRPTPEYAEIRRRMALLGRAQRPAGSDT